MRGDTVTSLPAGAGLAIATSVRSTPADTTDDRAAVPHGPASYRPVPHRLVARTTATGRGDVVTLRLAPLDGTVAPFRPAQFSMVGVPGVGEVPISISSRTTDREAHEFTVRSAGAVTRALLDREVGGIVTVRGPFGHAWQVDQGARPVLFVAGGIGLAPLRALIDDVVRTASTDADRVGPALLSDIAVLVGARTPDDIVFRPWLDELARAGCDVRLTVDEPDTSWSRAVGLVTELLPERLARSTDAQVFVCGPDVMMAAAVRRVTALGVPAHRVQVTLERNMQCGAGWCGHCQLGPLLVCRDGPVVRADELGTLLEVAAL